MKESFLLLIICLSLFIIVNSCSDSGTGGAPIYNLSMSAEPVEAGSISPSSNEFNQGEQVEISASANEGWMFDGWQGDHTGDSNPATVTMSADKDIIALFTERTYPLTVNTDGEGKVDERVVQTKTTDYPDGTIVELTATPAEGWRFSHWNGDTETDENPFEIVIEEAKEVTAVFIRREYPLTISIEGEGTVSEEIVQGKTTDYPYETVVELTANPANGWVFSHWKGDLTNSENPTQIKVIEEKSVTAVFKLGTFAISYSLQGEGSVSEMLVSGSETEAGVYEYESMVELTAYAEEGWKFSRWESDTEVNDNPITIEINGKKNIKVVFERRDYPLTVNIEGEGTVAEEVIQAKATNYPYETNVQLTATASEGWVLSRWEGDMTGSENPTIVEVTGEKTVTAVFEEAFYLHENGVTVTCPNANIGDSGTLFGITYYKRARDQITLENAATTCTSGLTNMSEMFSNTFDFNGDISSWDVSSVSDMSGMFNNARNFNQDIGSWDVSSVRNMRSMFDSARSFYGDISGWDVSSVTDMSEMFNSAYSFNIDIDGWDVSSVTDMSKMFSNSSNFNQDLKSWDVSSVTDMSRMFYSARSFNQDIGNWDVSSVTDMSEMFNFAYSFNIDIDGWDVSSVTDMSGMFAYAEAFNGNIENWDVSSVTDMSGMFAYAEAFNGNIENWDVFSVTNMRSMFFRAYNFNGDISSWDVSSVSYMSGMFRYAQIFNREIGNWDVSSVTRMNGMFFSARAFNGDIGSWDVSSVTNMSGMLASTTNFNQDLKNWCVKDIQSEPQGFSTSSSLTDENKPVWGTCPGTPSAINLDSPANSSTGVSFIPTLSWFVDDDATIYQLQVFEGTDPMIVAEMATSTSYEFKDSLKPNTTYFWKVRGINENKNLIGSWSAMWSFTTNIE